MSATGRGLCLAPATEPGPPPRLVPWAELRGLSADGSAPGPDGRTLQRLEILSDRGQAAVLLAAPDLSELLSGVAAHAEAWRRARGPAHARRSGWAARCAAAWLTLAALVLRAASAVGPRCRWAAAGAAAMCRAVSRFTRMVPRLPAARRAVAAVDTTVGWCLAVLRLMSGAARAAALHTWRVVLRPAWQAVADATAPARGRFARTAAGMALATAWRRAGALGRRAGSTPPAAWARGHARLVGAGVVSLALVGAGTAVIGASGPVASGIQRVKAATSVGPITTPAMSGLLGSVPHSAPAHTPVLPPASAPPAPAPPSLATATPLAPHEVFGFAPYWTLPQSGGFDVQGLTTIAYFAVPINPDGTLDHSGAGWNGYQSQALVDLVNRAHAAGDRVVLTVNDFGQSSLNALTSSPTAATTLASALVAAVEAKNLDGVNLDLEGEGSGDQKGLTALMATVSTALHQVNPHWQVTMDTYASSAGDPGGFYDIPALAPYVDGFFVMAYQLNLESASSAASPLTSAMFSDLQTAAQYAAAVPPSKVILGLPFYGVDWPTSDGTQAATATGGATPLAYSQIVSAGHPLYWDPVTDTAWTSYQVGNQWHETYFEDPTSLYMAAQMAQWWHLAGVGIWALGMDGSNSGLLAALDGFAPAAKLATPGPDSTTTSTSSTTSTSTTAPSGFTTGSGQSAAGGGGSGAAPTTTTTQAPGGTPGTTTTTAPAGPYAYSGTWQGQQVSLTEGAPGATPVGTPLGELTGFTTDDPALACLAAAPGGLSVWQLALHPGELEVVAVKPTDCADATFTFSQPTGASTSQPAAQPSLP